MRVLLKLTKMDLALGIAIFTKVRNYYRVYNLHFILIVIFPLFCVK